MTEPSWLAAALALLCLLVIVGLTWRDAGTYAHTFADERTYSYYSRLQPLEKAAYPSFLYFKVYSSTQACGTEALACSRLLNATLFAAALVFLYLVARRFASWPLAALVVCVTAVSPFNSYTAYFMPESMYFLGVWVLLWLITGDPRSRWVPWLAGVTVGLLAMVKLHGLFLVPATGLMMFHAGFGRTRLRGGLGAGAAFLVAVLLTRFGGGMLLAGKTAISVLGAGYESTAEQGTHTLPELALGAARVFWNHLQALSVLFAIPLAATLTLAPLSPSAKTDPARRLQLIAVVFLLPLMLITAVFSAKITGAGPYELAGRIHLRYYNFLFPLLLVVAAAQFDRPGPWPRFSPRVLIPALLVLGVGAWALVAGLDGAIPVPADCPELFVLNKLPQNFYVGAVGGLVLLATWAVRPRLGAGLYLWVALPIITLSATAAVSQELRRTKWPAAADTGGEVALRLLGTEGVEHLEVLTSNAPEAFRALFTLNNVNGSFQIAEPGSTFLHTEPKKEWLLVFGEYTLPDPHRVVVQGDGFSLVHYE